MNLSSRLDSIQDQILSLYERDSDDLRDQIKFWELTRKENVLLHYARKQGLRTLSQQPVPSLASSESKAREAIEMTIVLTSLANSPYGREPWTMQECSRERLLAAPPYCMKKGGGPVQVMFDNDAENVVEHTSWDTIYYQDEDDQWRKVQGQVDLDGLFYTQEDGLKVYYVSFKDEANKYSQTGKWSLIYNNNLLASVDSSPGSSAGPLYTSSPHPARHRRSSTDSTSSEAAQRYQRPQRQRKQGEQAPQGTQKRVQLRGRSRSRSRSRRREVRSRSISLVSQASGSSSPTGFGRRPPKQPDSTRRRRGVAGGGRGRSGRSPSGSRQRSRSRSRRPEAPSPEEVGSSREQPKGGSVGRLGRLLQEARDPPGICLRGPANTLKCLRYSLKSKHSSQFSLISTTWHWTESVSTARIGRARMLITFESEQQRSTFLTKVTLPKSVSYFLVNLGDV
ncbi:E2 [Eptesicus regulus papillomavirus]|nr:E2 [Eptesicus regulus papillomavirus]